MPSSEIKALGGKSLYLVLGAVQPLQRVDILWHSLIGLAPLIFSSAAVFGVGYAAFDGCGVVCDYLLSPLRK